MQRSDWIPAASGRTETELESSGGYMRADGQGGNPLVEALPNDTVDAQLSAAYAALRARFPSLTVGRYHVHMPWWHGDRLPTMDDYPLLDAPHALTTTGITVILVPHRQLSNADLGYHFRGSTLPSLRQRLQGVEFQGLVGNLGYYMTSDLITGKFRWSHNRRYPDHPLPEIPAYIGFHWQQDVETGTVCSAFESAHPSAVGIRTDGAIEIVHDLGIETYTVRIGGHAVQIDAINTPDAEGANIVAFTPALHTPAIERHSAANARPGTASETWQTYAPSIPLGDAADRVHVFIANQSDGHMPREQVVAVWDGAAPLPSFGAVLSFKRAYFESLFSSVEAFKADFLNRAVQIIPAGTRSLGAYQYMLGGLVPVVIDGQHLYHAATVADVVRNLRHFGNASSPIAQTGRETQNFDVHMREPAGVLLQTETHTGWVLFDGRHELSIGASVIDVAVLLKKLETAGYLAAETIRQAVFVDGGSAMKVYDVSSSRIQTRLEPLNRTAAGARNGPNTDYDGLNLYSTLALALEPVPGR